MAQESYFWGGTVTGDASLAPYSDDAFSDLWAHLFTLDRTVQGVLPTMRPGFTGLLEVANPAGTTVRVPTGMAIVDGKLYTNDANVDFAAAAANNYYTVVLRKSWAGGSAQTVRAALLGPNAGVPPVVTQNDGVTWEIALATIFNNAGTIEITDVRDYVRSRRRRVGIPAVGAYDSTTPANINQEFKATWDLPDGKDCQVTASLVVPDDYHSDLKISAVLRVGAAGGHPSDIYGRIYFNWGRCGEQWDEHDHYPAYAAESVPTSAQYCVFEETLSPISPGDVIKIVMERDATNVLDTINDWVTFYTFMGEYVPFT